MTRWWADAVIYQVYPRSFADANGDGLGDLDGIRSRIGYLAELGVDAVWLSPFYKSPMNDAGYDVADFRDVDPRFGTLEDFDALVDEAHARGMRVIIDIVPNHSSNQHPWFQEALAAKPGSAARRRYHFADSDTGPPNDW
ncbi:MAG TPA: alpha-amylase, partial [Candidatus Stackebrandtia faecavium]|nr:alpha-amylase [Candidatus Stackebrandtia faecavium]